MELTPRLYDALNEIMNQSMGRAAKMISSLVNAQVVIEKRQIALIPISELEKSLPNLGIQQVNTVQQVFIGSLKGIAMVILETETMSALVKTLADQANLPDTPEVRDNILAETGNIILSSFTGTFGSLLGMQVRFTVPQVHLQVVSHMLESLNIEQHELEHILIVQSLFQLVDQEQTGSILLVMGIQSLDTLLHSMRSQGLID